jgi:hypothetical protein
MLTRCNSRAMSDGSLMSNTRAVSNSSIVRKTRFMSNTRSSSCAIGRTRRNTSSIMMQSMNRRISIRTTMSITILAYIHRQASVRLNNFPRITMS